MFVARRYSERKAGWPVPDFFQPEVRMPSQIPEPQDQRMEDADVEPGLIDIGSQRIRVVSHDGI